MPLILPTLRPSRRIALVGTYPPTACGLATFTSNLRSAIVEEAPTWHVDVVRVVDEPEPIPAREVAAEWVQGDITSLRASLDVLNAADVVLLQHEYGLFGGSDGDDVLLLAAGLGVPLVVVVHTALLAPSPHQQQVLDALLRSARVAVVQSEAARRRLLVAHGSVPTRVVVVPHGAAANFVGPPLTGVPRPMVLTWGLVGPGKGIEHGISAVAQLTSVPRPVYVVAGQTHPRVRAREGEQYRDALRARARSLGASDRVVFDDAYRDWPSLRALVRSADVVLLPYDSREQVSSGVLVEALASAKPVVATRFPHAEELLSEGAGILIDHGDIDAMAASLRNVLHEPGVAARMAAEARRAAVPLLWPAVGATYCDLVEDVVSARAVA